MLKIRSKNKIEMQNKNTKYKILVGESCRCARIIPSVFIISKLEVVARKMSLSTFKSFQVVVVQRPYP